MRIVEVCPYAMDRPGGVQRHVRDLSAWLAAQGHEVTVVAPPAPGRAPRRSGRLVELGRSRAMGLHGTAFEISLARPRDVRRLADELRAHGPGVVHLHTPWTPLVAWQVWRALRLPTVTTIHATLPQVRGTGLADRYIARAARHFLRRSAAVIVPSEAPLPFVRHLAPGIRAHVLPPAVDLGAWRAEPAARGGDPHLVFLGRLEPRKGVDVLLTAWPRIAEALPRARLTVAGDGSLAGRVRRAAGDRLTWAGRVDDAGARALLARAHLFLAPAPWGESYGLVLAEAMAAGAVPVAAANAGYASVIGPAQPDLLVPPGDADALAGRVIALAGRPGDLATLSDWARDRARAADIAEVGPRYENLLQEAARGGSTGD